MYQSESINELATALCKCQAEMSFAVKDSTNPAFRSNYASLSAVWDAIREPMTKNGLSISQTIQIIEGKTTLVTILMHISGQWIKSLLPIKTDKDTCQGWGSGITYARRYSLAAIIGCVQDDDDGNDAEPKEKKKSYEKKENNEPKDQNQAPPTDAEINSLIKLKDRCKPEYIENIEAWLKTKGISSFAGIKNRHIYETILNGMENHAKLQKR